MTSEGNSKVKTDFVNDLVLKLLKRRSMAKLLVLIMRSLVNSVLIDSNDLLILGNSNNICT
jgi:hypothetical protein